jgi:hypothetical protein
LLKKNENVDLVLIGLGRTKIFDKKFGHASKTNFDEIGIYRKLL